MRVSTRAKRGSSYLGLGFCALLLVGIAAGCGGGKDNSSFHLLAGPQRATDEGPLVLFVTEAGRADSGGNRVSGNRVSAYRLGSDGLLPAAPSSSVGTAENPRRLLLQQQCVGGESISTLYVATLSRVEVYAVDDSGIILSPPISETAPDEAADGTDIAIANNHLYVAAPGASRIDAYPIASGGGLPAAPTSCARGLSTVTYAAVVVSGNLLLAGGFGSVDSFLLAAGELPSIECVSGAVTERAGSTLIPRALALILNGSALYVAEEADRRIFNFAIEPGGTLPVDPESVTSRLELFERLLLDGDLLYASAFSGGNIMAFRLSQGLLPPEPFSETSADPDTLPVGLLRQGEFLYVAEGGIDRIDAFAVAAENGALSPLPVSSTETITGSFPNDLALGTFPPAPCP